MTSCYILRLNNGKFYVGKTDSIEERMIEHYSGEGAKWTGLHYPVEILEIEPFTHKWQESYTTLIMMKKHGVENVRGGPWCQINLQFQPKLHLLDETKTIQENYDIYTKARKGKYCAEKTNSKKETPVTLIIPTIPKEEIIPSLCIGVSNISLNIPESKFNIDLFSIKTSDSTNFNIYAIKSSGGKYFISRNNTITESKFFGNDTVESITLLKENSSNGREVYAYTILHMFKYGIDNVRGGGITSKVISYSSNVKYQSYFSKLNANSTLEDVLDIVK